ncbi:MAG: acyl-CoA dehydrogenase family protein [Pseudomonadota bacterium]
MKATTATAVLDNVRDVAGQFGRDGVERRERRHLERADFQQLSDAGMTLTGVPAAAGGLWESLTESVALYCALYRALAAGDPSVALVSTMHPAVLGFWLMVDAAPDPYAQSWQTQRAKWQELALSGHWFGTIASEPGSAGDLMATRATATQSADGSWAISGAKHMGSGSGITSFMVTVAKPQGEDLPEVFMFDTRARPWDGSAGVRLMAEWDGIGMAATQSHAFHFDAMPAERYAWHGRALQIFPQLGPFINCLFAAVTVGILDAALTAARTTLGKRPALKTLEETEWTAAETGHWQADQILRGMIGAVQTGDRALLQTLHGKVALSRLAEDTMTQVGRAIGGRAFSRSAPFAQWNEDVRALGFLRPPWALAHERLFEFVQADAATQAGS